VGRLCRTTDASGVTHQAYDVFGNLSQQRTVEIGIDRSLLFGHDSEDRPSALTTSGGKAFATVRDIKGRAQRVLGVVNGSAVQIVKATVYRGDGQPDTTTLGNNVVLDRAFDSSGAPNGLVEIGLTTGGGGNDGEVPTAPEWALILLAAILLWQMTRARQVGRNLHSVWPIAALVLLAATTQAMADEALQLDTRGNIKSRNVDGRTSVYRYDRIDRLNNETGVTSQAIGMDANANRSSDGLATYTAQANGNRITVRNGVTLTYDAAGNLLSDQTRLNGATVNRSFSYTLSGSLKTVSIGGVLRATYTYNAQNQRTRKLLTSPVAGTPATTLYRYDTQGHLIEEIAGSAASASGISVTAGQSLVTYVWKDDIPSAVIYAPNSQGNPGNASERIAYLHTDHLDSPRKASDSAGRVVWSWESDAFGSTAALDDPDGDGTKTSINLRFPGQYLDAESGLHYNWHRYYDPLNGRYTQSDPIGLEGGASTYGYAAGAPLDRWDVDGQKCSVGVHVGMQLAVNLACKWSGPRRCLETDDCSENARKISTNSACAATRRAINNRCFNGGDLGHRQAEEEAKNAIKRCMELRPKCCGDCK
jgi:RHS repeat-associated protein